MGLVTDVGKIVLVVVSVLSLFFLPLGITASSHTPLLVWIQQEAEGMDNTSDVVGVSPFVNNEFLFFVDFAVPELLDSSYNIQRIPDYRIGNVVQWNTMKIIITSYMANTDVDVYLASGKLLELNETSGEYYVRAVTNHLLTEFVMDDLTDETVWLRDHKVVQGTFKVVSSKPVTCQYSTLGAKILDDTTGEDGEHAVDFDSDDHVFSFYGDMLYTKVAGDLWISAYTPTVVNITDVTDGDDSTVVKLSAFSGWFNLRNQDVERMGFEDDMVLITADHPVTIIGGYEDNDIFTQVYGKNGQQFMTPVFEHLTVYSPSGARVEVTDLEGGQGSADFYLGAGEYRTLTFRVQDYYKYFPDHDWGRVESDAPIYVFTHRQEKAYLRYNQSALIGGDRIAHYSSVPLYNSIGITQGLSPTAKKFRTPVFDQCYIYLTSTKANTNLTYGYEAPGIVAQETSISVPNAYQTLRVNISHRLDDNLTNDWFLDHDLWFEYKASDPMLMFVSYTYNQYHGRVSYYDRDAQELDLIPGMLPPSPLPMDSGGTGLPIPMPLVVVGSMLLLSVEVASVVGGGVPSLNILIAKPRKDETEPNVVVR